MKKHPSKINLTLLLLFALQTLSAQIVTISGYLSDASNGEALLFANVSVKNTTNGINTNEYGFYSLDIPANEEVTIEYSYLGFKTHSETFQTAESKTINIKLQND
jgi:hypothetical protein